MKKKTEKQTSSTKFKAVNKYKCILYHLVPRAPVACVESTGALPMLLPVPLAQPAELILALGARDVHAALHAARPAELMLATGST